eukprot:6213805-Pleurochrysis_carterae.AAC.2
MTLLQGGDLNAGCPRANAGARKWGRFQKIGQWRRLRPSCGADKRTYKVYIKKQLDLPGTKSLSIQHVMGVPSVASLSLAYSEIASSLTPASFLRPQFHLGRIQTLSTGPNSFLLFRACALARPRARGAHGLATLIPRTADAAPSALAPLRTRDATQPASRNASSVKRSHAGARRHEEICNRHLRA